MITIPECFWKAMLDAFANERRPVEQVCYLDGVVDANGDGVVTTLTIPAAHLHPQRFEVTPEAMSQAGKHFRADRLRRLAQVHTHPAEWTGHSPWDDQKAYSQLPGAVSIVLPHFARRHPALTEAGIHLRMPNGWRQLAAIEVNQHMRVVPSLLDFRTNMRNTHGNDARQSNRVERHEGDLGGKLCSFGEVRPMRVSIVIAPERAAEAAVQHAAWMAVNLLCRFDRIVERVTLVCPPGVTLRGLVVPLAPRPLDLHAALLAGAESIGVVPAIERPVDGQVLLFGSVAKSNLADSLYVEGNGWCGGVSKTFSDPVALGPASAIPFGPYIAACLAASEIFRKARMRIEEYPSPDAVYYSAWSHRVSPTPVAAGPREVVVALDAAIAGVGAVGCAVMHNLWACPGISGAVCVADNDAAGLDVTNLNRYALFGKESVGHAKASEASRIAADADMQWLPTDGPIESLANLPARVISAVDRNRARQAIQNRYPARIFSGSTMDLRAEVLRCGPPGIGACLRCYNEPEKIAPDEDLSCGTAPG